MLIELYIPNLPLTIQYTEKLWWWVRGKTCWHMWSPRAWIYYRCLTEGHCAGLREIISLLWTGLLVPVNCNCFLWTCGGLEYFKLVFIVYFIQVLESCDDYHIKSWTFHLNLQHILCVGVRVCAWECVCVNGVVGGSGGEGRLGGSSVFI